MDQISTLITTVNRQKLWNVTVNSQNRRKLTIYWQSYMYYPIDTVYESNKMYEEIINSLKYEVKKTKKK